MPILAIVGSREYPCYQDVYDFVHRLKPTTKVLSGYARGVDRWATSAARNRGLEFEDVPAEWERLGRTRAGFVRNTTLVERADYVVAFWEGGSPGTLDSITKAHALGKLHSVYINRGGNLTTDRLTGAEFAEKFAVRMAAAQRRAEARGDWPQIKTPAEAGADAT